MSACRAQVDEYEEDSEDEDDDEDETEEEREAPFHDDTISAESLHELRAVRATLVAQHASRPFGDAQGEASGLEFVLAHEHRGPDALDLIFCDSLLHDVQRVLRRGKELIAWTASGVSVGFHVNKFPSDWISTLRPGTMYLVTE